MINITQEFFARVAYREKCKSLSNLYSEKHILERHEESFLNNEKSDNQ